MKNFINQVKKVGLALSFLCITLLGNTCWGQTLSSIRGQITDQESGQILAGAHVFIQSLSVGAVSDGAGQYHLEKIKPGSYKVKISYFGYSSVSKDIHLSPGERNIDFSLREDPIKLDDVVITGTRTKRNLKEVPVITKVIGQAELQKIDAINIKDVLEAEIPGLEFSQHGYGANMTMQGLDAQYILFLVDGERMAGETGGNIDYSRLNLENVERVEIVKGASSSLYGSNAMGGVINIITKKQNNAVDLSVHSRWSEFNAWKTGAFVGLKKGFVKSQTYFNYSQIDPYVVKEYPELGTITSVKGHKTWDVKQKLAFNINKKLDVSVQGGYYRNYQENLGYDLLSRSQKDRYYDYSLQAKATYKVNDDNTLELAHNFDQYDKFNYLVKKDEEKQDYSNMLNISRLTYNYKIGSRHQMLSGIEFNTEELMTDQFEYTDNNAYASKSRYEGVAFVQDEFALTEKINIVAGLRFNQHEVYGFHTSPKVNMIYKLFPLNFRLGYANGFRSPSLKELYSNWDHMGMFRIIGNSELQPETNNYFSASVEYAKSGQSISVNSYYNDINNKIDGIWNATQDTLFYQNFDRLQIFGVDAEYSAQLPYGFRFKLSYSYVYDRYPDESIKLTTTSPHTAVTQLEYNLKKKNYQLSVNLNGRYTGAKDFYTSDTETNDAGETETIYTKEHVADWMMWKMTINQTFYNHFQVSMGLNNLFDYVPSNPSFNSSLSPGRSWFISTRINLGGFYDRIKSKRKPTI